MFNIRSTKKCKINKKELGNLITIQNFNTIHLLFLFITKCADKFIKQAYNFYLYKFFGYTYLYTNNDMII